MFPYGLIDTNQIVVQLLRVACFLLPFKYGFKYEKNIKNETIKLGGGYKNRKSFCP